MTAPHFAHWPPNLPHQLTLPETSLFYNAEVSARRYPHKPFLLYYGEPLGFARFHDEVTRLAGFLHEAFNTRAGGATAAISSPSPKKSRPVRGRASGSKTESCVGAAPGRVRGSP